MQIPQRSTLASQVAEIIRRGIGHGEWSARIPPERELCRRFKVSRRTVRTALAALEREGLLVAGQGRRRCVAPRAPALIRRLRPRTVGILWMGTAATQGAHKAVLFRGLEHHLHAAGFEVELRMGTALRGPQCIPRLEALVRDSEAGCWLLSSASAPVQQWFSSRHVPALLAGTPHEGVRLPSFDLDLRAVCRHAARTFRNLGHERAMLLIPNTGFAGDLRCEEGFQEIFPFRADDACGGGIVRHDGTLPNIRRALDASFRTRHPPTAVLVTLATHALAALTHILRSGRRVPRDVSLISRDNDDFFAHVTPSVARYVWNHDLYTKRVAEALVQLARAGLLPPREALFYPRLQKGDSLGRPGP
jgi:DNA-binding LacI/PurR family transcriptional regulator